MSSIVHDGVRGCVHQHVRCSVQSVITTIIVYSVPPPIHHHVYCLVIGKSSYTLTSHRYYRVHCSTICKLFDSILLGHFQHVHHLYIVWLPDTRTCALSGHYRRVHFSTTWYTTIYPISDHRYRVYYPATATPKCTPSSCRCRVLSPSLSTPLCTLLWV